MPPNRSMAIQAPVRSAIVSARSDRGGAGGGAKPETEVVVTSADGPVGTVPVLLAQLALQHLAGPRHGEGVDDLEAPRRLVAGDQRLDVLAKLLDVESCPGAEHEHRVHAFAPRVVR